jgi:hypothetical protein
MIESTRADTWPTKATMQIEFNENRDAIEVRSLYEAGDLIAFVGAGLACSAGMPTWSGMVETLLAFTRSYGVYPQQLADIESIVHEGNLIDALTEIESAITPTGFGREIERMFDDSHIDRLPPVFDALANLAPKLRGVMTTNLDRLLERAFGGDWTSYARPTADLASKEKWIFKIHGTLQERSTWVLTRPQYRRALYADPLQQALVSGLFWGGRRLLFLGYNLQDPDFDEVIGKIGALAQGQPPRHFALVDQGQVTHSRRKKLAESGLTLIPYANPDGTHSEVTRFLEFLGAGTKSEKPKLREKLLLLFVSSNPYGTVPIKVERELKIIREAIELSEHRDQLELDTVPAATLHDVRRALLKKPYHIVHMSGHGEESGLVLEDIAGKMDKIPPESLAELFSNKAHPKGELRCVLLNTCHSISTGVPLSKTVPFTIAMEGRLADAGAIEFSRGFYDALGAGLDYDKAYDEGVICRNIAAPTGSFVAKLLRREA